MRIENVTLVDGQHYHPGDEIWDLGSFVATSAKGRKRNYEGLSKDVEKLPHYVDTGSSAFCLDTGDFYKYLRSTDIWYKIGNNQASGEGGGVSDYNNLNGKPQINGVTLQGNMTLEDLGINAVIYSYDERVVGKWVDGKPLYEKTIDFGNLPNATIRSVPHEIENVDTIWLHDGFVYDPLSKDIDVIPISYPSISSNATSLYFKVNHSSIKCNSAIDRTGLSAIVSVRYTKTTD